MKSHLQGAYLSKNVYQDYLQNSEKLSSRKQSQPKKRWAKYLNRYTRQAWVFLLSLIRPDQVALSEPTFFL